MSLVFLQDLPDEVRLQNALPKLLVSFRGRWAMLLPHIRQVCFGPIIIDENALRWPDVGIYLPHEFITQIFHGLAFYGVMLVVFLAKKTRCLFRFSVFVAGVISNVERARTLVDCALLVAGSAALY